MFGIGSFGMLGSAGILRLGNAGFGIGNDNDGTFAALFSSFCPAGKEGTGIFGKDGSAGIFGTGNAGFGMGKESAGIFAPGTLTLGSAGSFGIFGIANAGIGTGSAGIGTDTLKLNSTRVPTLNSTLVTFLLMLACPSFSIYSWMAVFLCLGGR